MKKIIYIFTISFVILTLTNYSNGQTMLEKVRQIKVLESTLKDVEKLFGKPDIKRSQSISNYLDEGSLHIDYATGTCDSKHNLGWNVSRETILRIIFQPSKKKSFSAHKIDQTKLKKVYDESYQIYSDETEGITYEVQLGKVQSFEYNPTSKQDFLKCPK